MRLAKAVGSYLRLVLLTGLAIGCGTEPSDIPILEGQWSGSSAGAIANRLGLVVRLACVDGQGVFPGPVELDTDQRFVVEGELDWGDGVRPARAHGYLSEGYLAVAWRSRDEPIDYEGPFYFLAPSADGEPNGSCVRARADYGAWVQGR